MKDEDEPAGKFSRRSDIWGGALRVDCSDIPPKQAAKWLSEYRDVVERHIIWFRKTLHYTIGLADEDLRTVGQMAVLEACQTYDAGARGATLRTWVGTVVRWRLTTVLTKLTRFSGEHVNHTEAVNRYESSQIDEFETRMDFIEQLEVVGRSLAELPHRTRIVFFQRLTGVDEDTIGKALGISAVRTEQIMSDARAQLRAGLETWRVASGESPDTVLSPS